MFHQDYEKCSYASWSDCQHWALEGNLPSAITCTGTHHEVNFVAERIRQGARLPEFPEDEQADFDSDAAAVNGQDTGASRGWHQPDHQLTSVLAVEETAGFPSVLQSNDRRPEDANADVASCVATSEDMLCFSSETEQTKRV